VGSTRSGLLIPTSAVAIDLLAAALSAPRCSASTASASPTFDATALEPNTLRSRSARRLRHRARRRDHHLALAPISRPIMRAERARDASRVALTRSARALRSLLHARGGRHALDESARSAGMHQQGCRPITDRAVKNLRFVRSAVLLLNFREVSDFHFCSISVAM
jgi:hypothetical protein